jgi:signal transduction histidine kinase
MERTTPLSAAQGITDEQDRLLSADELLADLQLRCGGSLPGPLAIPELLRLVYQARTLGLRLAREFTAFDGVETVTGFARIDPSALNTEGGCELLIDNWQRRTAADDDPDDLAALLDSIDRSFAEVALLLDAEQRVQLLEIQSPDADELGQMIEGEPGKNWTEYLELKGIAHQQPMHWRLLDGASCRIPGSDRSWRARLFPGGADEHAPTSFELLLVAEEALPQDDPHSQIDEPEGTVQARLIGQALTPALRQPVARIIANAETIRAKLAGPLRPEYSEYAGNIATAGQHLTAMLEDLSDLEVVEAPGFTTIREEVELGDAARRAAGILGVRAQARNIQLDVPEEGDSAVAIAEFRRVLQILINLIGNALSYSPEESAVTVSLAKRKSDPVAIIVKDEGPGVSEDQAAKIFNKFERLGRTDQGGSGLGLYISRQLALAMGGDLQLESKPGEGAKFRLTLPAANPKKKKG